MRKQQFTFTRRQCYFCRKKIDVIDFKDVNLLQRYLTPWAKMKAAHDTGTCAKHQRRLAEAIKRARFMALMPYVKR
ncbi:30S ribosomal protein S18 [Candidatus Berkelbacteria bacterium RBG_13_40_8]|uniref:Small ribosomal subunit protein bS18 n=1 Tax=Candidatus Berkelbacteria bacterium RBG_13_40_8 TaxID=1797467 RepID=A0A1F5DQ60_9BACT|nr:MAG: 30S ribosomal protein S18 [Candidatus Berkelbacteria bacterium RBG_13_40_8]